MRIHKDQPGGSRYYYWQAENGGGARIVTRDVAVGTWETFVQVPAYDRPRPKKLLVYYGYLSKINGARDLVAAARQFAH